MACDVHYHLSRSNASHLILTEKCMEDQLQLAKGSQHVDIDAHDLLAAPGFWESYATVAGELGHHKACTGALAHALKLNSYEHQSVHKLAKALFTAKRFRESLAYLEPLLEQNDVQPHMHDHGSMEWLSEAWHDAAMCHYQLGNTLAALHYAQVAITLWPNVDHQHAQNYYQTLARVYLQLGRLDLARAALWGIANTMSSYVTPHSYFRKGMDILLHMYQHSRQGGRAAEVALELLRSTPMDDVSYFLTAAQYPGSVSRLAQCTGFEVEAHPVSGDGLANNLYMTPHPGLNATPTTTTAPPGSPLVTGEQTNAAVVYLCCGDEAEVRDLELSLWLLSKHFVSHFPHYPVFVLHDYLTPAHILHIRSLVHDVLPTTAVLRFIWLEPEDWKGAVPADVNPENKIFGYGMGYRHMCRFFSSSMDVPVLEPYQYVMRVDTDSFLLGAVENDPIATMNQRGLTYGWISAFRDEAYYVTGLWDTTKRWIQENGVAARSLNDWMATQLQIQNLTGVGTYDDVRFCFATNFFITDMRWVRGPLYQSFFRALEEAGGFYRYRWGDACVHFLAVAVLLDRDVDTHHFAGEIPYWHQGSVTFPEAPGLFSNTKW